MTDPRTALEEWRLYTGLICIQTRVSPIEINQSNEVWTVWARSQDEAVGHASSQSLLKFPNGAIVHQAMHDITDYAAQKPACLKAKEAGDAG